METQSADATLGYRCAAGEALAAEFGRIVISGMTRKHLRPAAGGLPAAAATPLRGGRATLKFNIPNQFGGVAQLVRVPDCRSGGCGFEPRRPRLK